MIKNYLKVDPCPFCGAEPEVVLLINTDDRCFIQCPKCGIEQGYSSSYEEAVEDWNRRV